MILLVDLQFFIGVSLEMNGNGRHTKNRPIDMHQFVTDFTVVFLNEEQREVL